MRIAVIDGQGGGIGCKIVEALRVSATKLLLPLTTSQVRVVGTPDEPLPHLIAMLVEETQAKGGGRDV